MAEIKKIDPSRRKYFTLGDGEDCLALIIPFENLKTFHRCISLLLEKDQNAVEPGVTGYYITHRGTFSNHHP